MSPVPYVARGRAVKPGAIAGIARARFTAGGPAWPNRATGVPDDVTVRLSIGEETFCGTFAAFRAKRRGRMVAGHNPPPASCRAGNVGRVVEK
jgi:hypothetical protein